MNRINKTMSVLISALCVLTVAAQAESDWLHEPPQLRDQRMQWWREARFGMFIHWGLYAIPAGIWKGKEVPGIGEWIMNNANIPREEYEQLAAQFNPVKYDPAEWVRIAREAGQKYIVITSKHHDGFCLFDSKVTTYDVVDATPYGKDLLKPLSEECRKQGIKFCVYYSIMDWHHPSQERPDPNRYNPTRIKPGRKQEYMDYMKAQIRELITQYDPAVLWFDGGWPDWFTKEDGIAIYNYCRSLKPSLIINDRLAGIGDFGTPEQYIPATGLPNKDWETCMTMNDTWGYKKNDHNWKSPEALIRNLVDIASKGGNYLLNVGPTAEGVIPEPSVERLKAMGAWLKVHGDAIYGTQASVFRKLPWGRCTRKWVGDTLRLYLLVFDWPQNGVLRVPGLLTDPVRAMVLDSGEVVRYERQGEDVLIYLPGSAPDPICSVVVLELKEKPKVVEPVIKQAQDGTVKLPAAEAICHGESLQYEGGPRHDNLGFWTNPADWAEWRFQLSDSGSFEVVVEVASPRSSSFEIHCSGQTLRATCPKTGDYYTYKPISVGTIKLNSGVHTLEIRAVREDWAPINVRAVSLRPVR